MRVILFVIVGTALTACTTATTQKYDVVLNNWLNKPEIELINSWGAPDNVYQLGDKKFIAYYSQHNRYIPKTTYRYQPFFVGGWPYYDPIDDTSYQVVSEICKTTFTIEAEKISNWSHQGSGCVAE